MIKTCYIIAGPNGAGKTTFAEEFLPKDAKCLNFINAGLIATGLSPFRPEVAAIRSGKLMLELIDRCIQKGESFAFNHIIWKNLYQENQIYEGERLQGIHLFFKIGFSGFGNRACEITCS